MREEAAGPASTKGCGEGEIPSTFRARQRVAVVTSGDEEPRKEGDFGTVGSEGVAMEDEDASETSGSELGAILGSAKPRREVIRARVARD